jgi:dTDP-4-dehydrorhamnose reductase
MMRVLVAGSSGQVARALAEAPNRGFTIKSFGRPDFDLERLETVESTFVGFRPDVVINAAAYTAVDKAEFEPGVAMRVNADGPGLLAELAANAGAPILHMSTDYVFAGDKASPYVESDPVGPVGSYGRSKLEGERRVAAANPNHLILRTAWVHAPYGTNFVRTMLRLAETRSELDVVADQHGAPTYGPDIAEGLLDIVARLAAGGPTPWGVYHMASSGPCVWADLAEHVFMRSAGAGGPFAKVNRISTSEYPTPARRPANSRLDCGKLRSEYGVALPDWRSGVDRCVARLLEQRRST